MLDRYTIKETLAKGLVEYGPICYFRMTSMAKAIDTLLSVQEKNGACLQSLQDRVPVNGLEAGGLDVRLSTEITPKIVGEVNSKLCEFSGMIESLNVDQTKQIHEMSFQMKAIGETQLKKMEEVRMGRRNDN